MACRLHAAGEEVRTLALIDPAPLAVPPRGAGISAARLEAEFAYDLLALAGPGVPPAAAWRRRVDLSMPLPQLAAAAQSAGWLPPELGPDEVMRLFELFRTPRRALGRYRPSPYPGRLTLLLADRPVAGGRLDGRRPHPAAAWTRLARGGAELESLPGDHYSILRAPAVAALAAALARRLAPGRRPAAHRPAAAATPVAPARAAPLLQDQVRSAHD